MYMYGATDSKSNEKLSALLMNAKLSKEIAKLSHLYQTSCLESYHSGVIHYPHQQHFHARECYAGKPLTTPDVI